MAEVSLFTKLLGSNKIVLADLRRKSASWFTQRAREILRTNPSGMRAESIMRGDQDMKSKRIIPGDMVMFVYDAKHKDTLPYWDKFPLVFPFKIVPGGFYGINLHYLPYSLRARLLDRLMVMSNNTKMNDTTRLTRLKWQMLSAFSQFAPAQACVKRYLFSHVMTPFKKVHPEDWATAMMLPTEQFQNQTSSAVWNDSKSIIRKIK